MRREILANVRRGFLAVALLLFQPDSKPICSAWADLQDETSPGRQHPSQTDPYEAYRKLDLAPKERPSGEGIWMFEDRPLDDRYRDSIGLEFEIINSRRPDRIRPWLKDSNQYLRSFAARALGILADKGATEELIEVAKGDSDPWVRGHALEALGWLKAGEEVLKATRKGATDSSPVTTGKRMQMGRDPGPDYLPYMAQVGEGRLKDSFDYAAQVRASYEAGIKREDIASAQVGRPAPSFIAMDSEGRTVNLADVLGKKIIVLTFRVAEW